MIRLCLADFAVEGVLAGSERGRKVLLSLLKKTPVVTIPSVAFLDFNNVAIATGSFLRDSVFAYHIHARKHVPQLYPVVANAGAMIIDELKLFLALRNDAFITCSLTKEGHVRDSRIVGAIDGRQEEALREVLARGEADAPTLAKTSPGLKPTVWNNRLSALVDRGLLMEVGTGKTRRYKPVLEGLTYGA